MYLSALKFSLSNSFGSVAIVAFDLPFLFADAFVTEVDAIVVAVVVLWEWRGLQLVTSLG